MAPMNRPKRQRKSGASRLLITTASLAATLGGWAVLANNDATANANQVEAPAPGSAVAAPTFAPTVVPTTAPTDALTSGMSTQPSPAEADEPTATPVPTDVPTATVARAPTQQLRRVMPMARTRSSR